VEVMKAWIALGVVIAGAAWADHFDPFTSMHGRPPAQHDTPSPEDLARLAPPPLDPAVARRIETLLGVRGVGGGLITDRGDRQFFTWQSQVWRQDGPRTWPVQLTGGEQATSVAAVAPDGSWLVVRRGGGLYVADRAGGPLRAIAHARNVTAELAYITDDSKTLYFAANDLEPGSNAIYRWTSADKWLAFDMPGAWHLVDHRGDRWLMVMDRGDAHAEVYEYDLAKKLLTDVLGQDESAGYEVAYGAKPGQVLVRTNKLGDYQRLYSFERGTLTPITPAMDHDVTAFRIDDARARIYYTVDVDGYERLNVLDARTLKRIELPALPESENQRIAGLSRNGRFVQIAIDGARLAPTVLTLDWKTKKLATWRAPATPELDVSKLAPVTLETYPARDGTKIPMFVRRPAACAEQCPVIVWLRRGHAGFDPEAQAYVDAGFVVVTPNVRGTAGYGKAWQRADGSTDVEDLSRYLRTAWAKDGRAPHLGVVGGAAAITGGFDAVVADHVLKDHPSVTTVKAPLLLVQSVNDPRALLATALQIHDELVTRGGRVMLVPDDNHVLQLGQTIAFFEEHLTAK
jgi:hypothetical protein